MGRDQIEAEDAPVVEMNGPGRDRIPSGFRLAFAVLGDDQQFRQPGLDVDMEVESCAGLTPSAADRPNDGGGRFEEGAVDGQDLAVQRDQRLGGLGRPRFEDFTPEMIEDRLQSGGVGQLVEVGEGAFTELPDGEMFLSLPRLAEILDGPEGPQRGVEEGQEVGDKDVIEEEFSVAVGRLLAKPFDEPFQRADVFGPDDLFGPDRQVAQPRLLRPDVFGSLGRWHRCRGSLLRRHEETAWPSLSKSASEDLMKTNPGHYWNSFQCRQPCGQWKPHSRIRGPVTKSVQAGTTIRPRRISSRNSSIR